MKRKRWEKGVGSLYLRTCVPQALRSEGGITLSHDGAIPRRVFRKGWGICEAAFVKPTGRDALKHLLGIAPSSERGHEEDIPRTPPFTRTGVVNGYAPSPILGVVLRVVTSTGLRSTNEFTFQLASQTGPTRGHTAAGW